MGKFRMLFSVLGMKFKSIAGILQINLSLSYTNMTHTDTISRSLWKLLSMTRNQEMGKRKLRGPWKLDSWS